MVLGGGHSFSKREMWDHMAREFDYTCAACWRRPDFDDSETFLATGYCRRCQPRARDRVADEDQSELDGRGVMR